MTIDFSIDVDKLSVKAILNTIQVDDFSINSKYIPMDKIVKADSIKFFNDAFNAAVPIFNVIYSGFYYEVPANIWKTFKLSEITLNYFDQYIQVGTTPIFVPPQPTPTKLETAFLQ
jgi:hypothetical protein